MKKKIVSVLLTANLLKAPRLRPRRLQQQKKQRKKHLLIQQRKPRRTPALLITAT